MLLLIFFTRNSSSFSKLLGNIYITCKLIYTCIKTVIERGFIYFNCLGLIKKISRRFYCFYKANFEWFYTLYEL